MCGISAIASYKPVAEKLFQCLINLEYRGYDSCGMALFDQQSLKLRKNIGNVEEVGAKERFFEMSGNTGIAHTRWATHGGVSTENSHPHSSNDQNFVIVHNGIFSNYKTLRKSLKNKGYQFHSDTDTEVFANLLQEEFKKTPHVEQAFCQAIEHLQGSYAIAMITTHQPDVVFAVKKDSPLVLGINDGTNYVSSDINAFIAETNDTVIIDDEEYVIMTKDNFQVKRLVDGQEVKKKIIKVQWDRQTAQRGGFSHYMLKEIFDQPQTVRNALHIPEEEIGKIAQKFLDKKQSYFVGVGTTYYVAMIGTYLFSQYAGLHVPAISSDEFPSLIPTDQNNHVLFFSQSGETYDTRMAIRKAMEGGAATSAIVNVVGSSISQTVEDCIFQGSGPEICVVSTKAALSQIIILWQIALKVGELNGNLTAEQAHQFRENFNSFPETLETMINEESGFIRDLAAKTFHVRSWLFMGKGIYYPIALESALKMKEVTYLHAEGLPAGFLKHGTLAMVDDSMYCLFFLPYREDSELYHSTMNAIEEVKARNGKIIAFCTEDDKEAQEILDHYFIIPKISPELTPLLEIVLAQLFSYYSALHLGLNIDKPRNLAKSVTVG
ncbi:MAG: glutamine--fructose-6-phosphate transaminase (isomerizing) [SAR324 cluster bacterium]|uniref:Glutamine--fructose-6-phosphate aminotransferase [isomerizing] n=1 Tax=SAR324 cluster bacterium TaxID=2024889 RepID=A0A2A4SST5_9DELT|nr:MAG: glutamine--fructose-6-phosphate transaminase (isomerizing) [SAR324 cluster bacterium]